MSHDDHPDDHHDDHDHHDHPPAHLDGAPLDGVRRRRMERAANYRSALTRPGLREFLAAPGVLGLNPAGADAHGNEHQARSLSAGVAVFRHSDPGHLMLLVDVPGIVSVSLTLRRDHLRTILAALDGEELEPGAVDELQVGLMDLDEQVAKRQVLP